MTKAGQTPITKERSMLSKNNKTSREDRSILKLRAWVPNQIGTHSLTKKIGMKSKQNNIKIKNNTTETEAKLVRNKSLAVNNEVPGKPIVTSTANKLITHNTGMVFATPDIKI